MDFIYHINCFHTLLKELYAIFGNLIVFLPWSSVYELLQSLFDILYLNNSGLPLTAQQLQEENSWPDCGHHQ